MRRGPAADLAPYLAPDTHAVLKSQAIRALGRIGDRAGAPEWLAKLLGGGTDHVEALQAAALNGAPSLEGPVFGHLASKDPAVQAAAVEALGWIANARWRTSPGPSRRSRTWRCAARRRARGCCTPRRRRAAGRARRARAVPAGGLPRARVLAFTDYPRLEARSRTHPGSRRGCSRAPAKRVGLAMSERHVGRGPLSYGSRPARDRPR